MRLKWAIVVVALCLIVTAVAIAYTAGTATVPEVIRAQRFELVDAEGKVCAVLSVSADGSTGLAMMDEGGKQVVGLGTGPDGGTGLALMDENGKQVVGLGTGADGGTGLALMDGQGKVVWSAP